MNVKKVVQVQKIADIHYNSTCESLTAVNVLPSLCCAEQTCRQQKQFPHPYIAGIGFSSCLYAGNMYIIQEKLRIVVPLHALKMYRRNGI